MVYELIKQYINWAETQTDKGVKSFVSDNERQYVGAKVRNFFYRKGVEQKEIPPYSPQSNGIAERKKSVIIHDGEMPDKRSRFEFIISKINLVIDSEASQFYSKQIAE